MSTNRYVLLRVCIPDFFLPFPPTIFEMLREESVCPNGFICVYMIYDKQAKKNVKTMFDCASAILKINKYNNENSTNTLLPFKITSVEPNTYEGHEINYYNVECLEKFDFQVEALKADKFNSEYKSNVFLEACKNSILDQTFDLREGITNDVKIMFPENSITKNNPTAIRKKSN